MENKSYVAVYMVEGGKEKRQGNFKALNQTHLAGLVDLVRVLNLHASENKSFYLRAFELVKNDGQVNLYQETAIPLPWVQRALMTLDDTDDK